LRKERGIQMKPRKLIIKGLNSFIEEKEIDFQRLTDKGLFGIFGPTGSGKSTILDAITIALYGSISRDSKDYINTNCTSLLVSYEFEIGVGSERKVYIADRIVNKDKATGSPKLKTSRLRELSAEGDIPIAEGANEVKSTVEKIIGLTADDFTRSVVLPQGKFSEFLKLTGEKRRSMLERIFRLERFGRNLSDRIRFAKREKNDSLNFLTGKMNSYEERGISEEKYKLLKIELKEIIEELDKLKDQKEKLDAEYEKYKTVWELQGELGIYRKEEKILEVNKQNIDVKKLKLKRAKDALNIKPIIEDLRDIDTKIKLNEEDLIKTRELLSNIKEKILNTEQQYEEWLNKKNTELPLLIEKEANLSIAIELQEKLKSIEKEISELRDEYQVRNKKRENFEEELKRLAKLKEEAAIRKESIEKRNEEIKVDPEYRDIVQRAYQTEEDYKRFIKEKDEVNRKLDNKSLLIRAIEEKLGEVLKQQDKCYQEVALTEEKIEVLSKNSPGDSSELISMKEKISEIGLVLRELEGNLSRKEELEKKLSISLEEKIEVQNLVHQKTAYITEQKQALEKIQTEIENIKRNNAASVLSANLEEDTPCPVCGSMHHPQLAEAFDESLLSDKLTLKESLEQEIRDIDGSLRKLEVRLGTALNNENFIKNNLGEVIAQIKDLKVDDLREEKARQEFCFNELNLKIEKWSRDKEAVDKNLGRVKEIKNSIDKEEVKLSENLKNEKSSLEELKSNFETLRAKCEDLEREYNSFKEELKLESIKDRVKELKDFEREYAANEKSLKMLADSINVYDKEKEAFSKEISNLQIELAKITESGKEKRIVLDRDKAKINELSEGKSPLEYINTVRNNKRVILESEEKLKNDLEREKKEKQKLSDKMLGEETNKLNFMVLKKDLEEKLMQQLNVFGFADAEEAKDSMLPEDVIHKVEAEVLEFEDKLKAVRTNIDSVIRKLGGNSIEEESWKELLDNRKLTADNYEIEKKNMDQKSHIIKQIEMELEELKVLNVRKKELEHVCSNLDDIAKLVEGNKFVEFVAMNQLKYISMEASKRLKDITRGRYALEIDSSGNFIMRDDFNGGSRRATSTLSGGETFLTSLCLALSLSSQIQLKGSAPLEFFFLDEGFGTLDSDLLETVMSSLERLHSDKLCVGIISHVEELKSRVPIKLLIEPAEHGKSGSKVKIELS
jgi:DNA repair protein SbcC/Rad50